MEEIICYCKNVGKEEIEFAIERGAKTLKNVQQKTGACTGNNCEEKNPSGKCCEKDIRKMLGEESTSESCCCCCE